MDHCEEEMVKKREIIAQIRKMEAKLSDYEKVIDFGQIPKYGFLSDMSLADLKDRLIALRFEVIENNEKKRVKIMDEKETMTQNLREARDFVDNERPQWMQLKKDEAERARGVKQRRMDAGNYPAIKTARQQLLLQSQIRRKHRVAERESRLNIKDPLCTQYEFEWVILISLSINSQIITDRRKRKLKDLSPF